MPKSIFNDRRARQTLLKKALQDINNINDPSNLVQLSPGDHLKAHLLLVKIFDGLNKNCFEKMVFAANMMVGRCGVDRKKI